MRVHLISNAGGSLTSEIIPNSVTFIGDFVFFCCSDLAMFNSQKENLSGFTLVESSVFSTSSTATLNISFGLFQTYGCFVKSFWGLTAANVHETAIIAISSSCCAAYCSLRAFDYFAVEGETFIASSFKCGTGELTATAGRKPEAHPLLRHIKLKGRKNARALRPAKNTPCGCSFSRSASPGICRKPSAWKTGKKGKKSVECAILEFLFENTVVVNQGKSPLPQFFLKKSR